MQWVEETKLFFKYRGGTFARQWMMGTLQNDDFLIQKMEIGDDYIAVEDALIITKDRTFVGISNPSPKAKLHLWHTDFSPTAGGIDNPSILLGLHPGNQAGYLTVNQGAYDNNTNVARFMDSGTTRVSINPNEDSYAMTVNGDAQATGMWINSDKRLKVDINSIPSQLSQLQLLRPTSYQYLSENQNFNYLPEEKQYGLIAQELQKVYPDLVKKSVETSEAGEELGEYLSINYNGLIPILISSVQEIDNKIKMKDQAIKALQQENSLLRSRLDQIVDLLDNMKEQ